jgi:hypothetical protein
MRVVGSSRYRSAAALARSSCPFNKEVVHTLEVRQGHWTADYEVHVRGIFHGKAGDTIDERLKSDRSGISLTSSVRLDSAVAVMSASFRCACHPGVVSYLR